MKSKKLTQFRSNRKNQESGSVLAELSLVLPMLTFLILAVTDFGMFLQSYFQICHIGREGLRTAVSTPDLTGVNTYYGKYVVTTDTAGVVDFSPPTGITPEHQFIHDRIMMLLKADNGTAAAHTLQLEANAVEIKTSCVGDLVQVELSAQYRPITPFNSLLSVFGFTPLTFNFTTKSEGSYLFNNCA